jgi:hypothetical protein
MNAVYVQTAHELESDDLSAEDREQIARRAEEAMEHLLGVGLARRKLLLDITSLLMLAAFATANVFVFRRFFDVSYFRWYLQNGSIISLVFAAFTLGFNLDKERDLISANPRKYYAANLGVHALFANQFKGAVGALIGKEKREPPPVERDVHPIERLIEEVWFLPEAMIATTLSIGLFLAAEIWFYVIAPFQYVVYLACGAPARTFAGSTWQPVQKMPPELAALAGPTPAAVESDQPSEGTRDSSDDQPARAVPRWKTVYSEKPVTFTATITAIVLWLISQFI